MEKRRSQRVGMEHLSVDVADGDGFFTGIVSDISRKGLCVTNLPKEINEDEKIFTILVTGAGRKFRMNARPRWHHQDEVMKSIGVEIINTPKGWIKYVKKFKPALLKDV